MYCYKCGNPLDEGDKFCKCCGAAQPITDAPSQAPQQPPASGPIYPGVPNVAPNVNRYHPPYQNPMYPAGTGGNPPFYAKKKKSPLFIIGMVVLAVVLLAVSFGLFINLIKGVTDRPLDKNELVLHDLKAEYPADWFKTETDTDTIALAKNGNQARILFSYFSSEFYYDSGSAINEMISEYENLWDSFHRIGEIRDVSINGIEWKQIEFNGALDGQERRCIQLVHSTAYDVYIMMYMSTEENFHTHLNEWDEIVDSVYLPAKEINSDAIKQKIVGEWDCGDTGYLVINQDGTYYFYKDSSKSTDNVVTGTYEASDGIPTYATGYAQGISFIATIQTYVVDGTEETPAADSKISYAFVPDGTGNFDGMNLNTGSHFEMIKITQ